MANRWLLKTEPSTYSFDQLMQERRTRWNGVRNAAALIHLRGFRTGDDALIYHSGAEKSVVGIARVSRGAYPDPEAADPRLVVVDLDALKPLRRPVPLAEVKADPLFADLGLVRISRLSVMPVSAVQWKRLIAMGSR